MEDNSKQSGPAAVSGSGAGRSATRAASGADDIVDFVDVARLLWSRGLLISSITLLFTLAGVVYAVNAAEWYRAEVLLSPARTDLPQSLVGPLGGLATLTGLSMGDPGSAEPVAILSSRGFARDFIEEKRLTTVLLHKYWDASAGRWKGESQKDWPDIRDAVEYFRKRVLAVNQDKRTNLVTLSIEWQDPSVAAQWANELVQRLNATMRKRALLEAEHNVRYLRDEIASTSVVSLQQSLARLLEIEMQKLMIARGNEEYSFKVLDDADPPRKRSRPQRGVIVTLAFLLGAITSVVGVILAHALSVRRSTIIGAE